MQKKILKMLASLALAATMSMNLPAIQAAEFKSNSGYEPISEPIFEDDMEEEELIATISESETELYAASYNFNSIKDTAEYLIQRIADRDQTITFTSSEFFTMQQLMDAVKEHTGNPVGGDYITWNYVTGSLYHSKPNGIHTYTLTMSYYTTAAQEMELSVKLEKVMKELDLDGLNDYQKVYTIYDYICKNVRYDDEHLNDKTYLLKYTTYAALVNGEAVGQGFATLFYRMCLMAGVDVRCITSENHAWNIVRIGDKYYNADTSFDAGRVTYSNFLKGNAGFNVGFYVRSEQYDTSEFHKAYPMSETDYPQTLEWYLDDNGVLTVYGPGVMSSPSPWMGDGSITEVVLKGITAIGDGAFANCIGITKVSADAKLRSIGKEAFSGCSSLRNVELQSLEEIGWQSFTGCTSLETFVFPEGTKNIGYRSFEGCYRLKYISIPDSVERIDMYAFYNCAALDNVFIPDSVTAVGTNAFRGCTSLKSIALPNGINSVADNMFYLCQELERIYIPDGVKAIGNWSFGECLQLKSITLPAGVESIGMNAFYDCRELEKIIIPKSVTEIGKNAFTYCKNLTIYGYENSAAEMYAIENDIPFVYLDGVVIPGDVNGDGSLSELDLIKVLNYIKGIGDLTPSEKKAADCYGNDGIVDIRDYCMLFNMMGR